MAECPDCGRNDFKNEHGMRIHQGRVHTDHPSDVDDGGNSELTKERSDSLDGEAIDCPVCEGFEFIFKPVKDYYKPLRCPVCHGSGELYKPGLKNRDATFPALLSGQTLSAVELNERYDINKSPEQLVAMVKTSA